MFKRLCALLAAFLLLAGSFLPVSAEERVSYCFSGFLPEDTQGLQGVFVTEVPQWECGIFCGSRQVLAGDVLTEAQLSQLTITPYAENETIAVFSYLPIFDGAPGAVQTLHLSLRGSKNRAPEASDSEVETYKNLEISGKLSCCDPEGETFTITLVKEPRRGSVTFLEDGSFIYTPKKNKVGTDRFTYTATDTAGNVSEEATVTIHIENPRIKGTFADMSGEPQEYEARFLRENGIFSGETIGGTLCFCPEKTVSQQEFLMMLMALTGLETDPSAADTWFSPWQQGALRAGLSTEVTTEAISKYEAAMLVSDVLGLTEDTAVSVFADPLTSEGAVSIAALEDAGLPCFADSDMETLTRREAALLLYAVAKYREAQTITFPWE